VLGIAQYRARDWPAAAEALAKSTALGGENAVDALFLAMAYWQMAKEDEARQWYDRAVRWLDKNQTVLQRNALLREELHRFRTEVAQVWGIQEKQTKDSEGKQ